MYVVRMRAYYPVSLLQGIECFGGGHRERRRRRGWVGTKIGKDKTEVAVDKVRKCWTDGILWEQM
jgi:hypothetical protein